MEKKAVVFINQYGSTPENGMGGRHYYLALKLSELGVKSYLVTANHHHLIEKQNKNARINEKFIIRAIKTLNTRSARGFKRILNWFIFSFKLCFLEFEEKPDLIVYSSPSPLGFLGAYFLAKRLKTKVAFEFRDIWPLTLTELAGISRWNALIGIMRLIELFALKNSDYIFSNLSAGDSYIKKTLGVVENYYWLPNGYDSSEFSLECKYEFPPAIKNKLSDCFTIVYSGTLGLANCLDVLLDAVAELKNKHLMLVIVGTGEQYPHLISKVQELKIEEQVHFLGRVNKAEVPAILSAADVNYLGWKKSKLYRYGIGSNKLPEYLVSGRPIIHSYSGEGDLVQIAEAGLTVAAESPKQIKDAMCQFMEMSDEQLQSLGRSGKRYAENELSYLATAKKLMDIL